MVVVVVMVPGAFSEKICGSRCSRLKRHHFQPIRIKAIVGARARVSPPHNNNSSSFEGSISISSISSSRSSSYYLTKYLGSSV